MIASLHNITTLDIPELEPYRTLRRPLDHLRQGIFIAEGEKVVSRMLGSDVIIQSFLLSPDWLERYRGAIEASPHAITLFLGEKKLLQSIVGHEMHQSFMGLGIVPSPLPIGGLVQKAGRRMFTVMVDGITNAENMGVIVRNCVCFGVNALLVLPTSCDPYLRRSVRNSMGNIFRLPIVYLSDNRNHSGTAQYFSEIEELKRRGFTLYAAHPQEKSVDIRSVEFSSSSCIVLGAEGHGVSSGILKLCDEFVTIPMMKGVDSLNVASASAVMLWEASQQRGGIHDEP